MDFQVIRQFYMNFSSLKIDHTQLSLKLYGGVRRMAHPGWRIHDT